MTDIVADLHSHTTLSDGTMKPDEVTEYANKNALLAIAVTDHDRVQEFERPLARVNGVDIISGIELRVEPESIGERVDVLGYGVTQSTRLQTVLDRVQENRKERAEAMIDLIEEETGVRLSYSSTESTGRPNIARAIAENENLEHSYGEAFNELIGNDCPCYLSREVPSFELGVDVLRESCAFLSLAHPYRYDNTRDALKLSKRLDGVECIYPYDSQSGFTTEGLDELAIDWFDLSITGGSDAHKPSSVGEAGLTKSHYEKFLDSAGLTYYSQHF